MSEKIEKAPATIERVISLANDLLALLGKEEGGEVSFEDEHRKWRLSPQVQGASLAGALKEIPRSPFTQTAEGVFVVAEKRPHAIFRSRVPKKDDAMPSGSQVQQELRNRNRTVIGPDMVVQYAEGQGLIINQKDAEKILEVAATALEVKIAETKSVTESASQIQGERSKNLANEMRNKIELIFPELRGN